MCKVKEERIYKNMITTYTTEGDGEVAFYSDNKEKFKEVEYDLILKEDLVIVKELDTRGEYKKVMRFKEAVTEKDKEKGDLLELDHEVLNRIHDFFIRRYEFGELVEETRCSAVEDKVYKIDGEVFTSFDEAHQYAKKNVEGYDFVDVTIIRRYESNKDGVGLSLVYELWCDDTFVTEDTDENRIFKELIGVKKARNGKFFERGRYEVFIDDNKDCEVDFENEARLRAHYLSDHYEDDTRIQVKKKIVNLKGKGRYNNKWVTPYGGKFKLD